MGRAAWSGRGPCAGPRRNKPKLRENGETNIQRGGSRARQSEQRETEGSHLPLPGTTSGPKRRSSDRSCRRTPGDRRDCCAAGNRAVRNRWVPAPIPGSVLSSLIHPHATVAIGWGSGQHSRTGFDSDSMFLENSPIWGQGIIARRTRSRAAGDRGPALVRTPGVQAGHQRRAAWGVGRHRHWKRVLGRCRCNGGFPGCWAGRNEASGEPVIVRIQNG